MRIMATDALSIAMRENLGARIKSLREERGLSQYVFSDMISMDRSYLIDIEKGKPNISLDILSQIARGLDLPISEVLREVDSFVYEHISFPEA
jgi:transcriptional regulator with XRE-family HTH domain